MLNSDFTLRRVGQQQAEILTDIHKLCFPRYWNREAFTDFFSVAGTFAFLIEKNERAVAMSVYRVSFEQADVLTIAVLPEWRGQGIARGLLTEMVANCAGLGVKKLFLEVEEGNNPAIKLYENSGFKHVGRRKLYYQQLDGSLTDALVMSRSI